jgi:hypothetical protein
MEIESMNLMDASSDGDNIRQRITKHKAEFDKVRKEMRKRQQAYEKQSLSVSTMDQVSYCITIF